MIQLLRDLYSSSPTAREAIIKIAKSKQVFLVVENELLAATGGNFYQPVGGATAEGAMVFSFNQASETLDPSNGANGNELEQDPYVNFGHELGHMFDDFNGVPKLEPVYGDKEKGYEGKRLTASEVTTIEFENKIRAELGITLRTHHSGFYVFDKKVIDATGKYAQSILVDDVKYDFSQHTPLNTLKLNLKEVFKSDNWWDVMFEVTTEDRGHTRWGFSSEIVPNWLPKQTNDEFTRITLPSDTEKKEEKK